MGQRVAEYAHKSTGTGSEIEKFVGLLLWTVQATTHCGLRNKKISIKVPVKQSSQSSCTVHSQHAGGRGGGKTKQSPAVLAYHRTLFPFAQYGLFDCVGVGLFALRPSVSRFQSNKIYVQRSTSLELSRPQGSIERAYPSTATRASGIEAAKKLARRRCSCVVTPAS